jgi:arabinan endo-1,5-alpha-L-arabinosidase
MLPLLAFACFFSVVFGLSIRQIQMEQQQPATAAFPPTRQTQQHTHDPTIIRVGAEYYLYSVGQHIFIYTAPSMAGPWEKIGSLLDANSVINKGDRAVPWAPSVIAVGETFYCFYSVSRAGCRDSAIGVATSASPGPGNWRDHGVVVQSATGEGSDLYPYNQSNTIDPSVVVLADGQGYLSFGSYWTGIYQVPLTPDLLKPASTAESEVVHLAYEPIALSKPNKNANNICGDPTGPHAIEGAFMSYHGGYYYLWFSHGRCCDLRMDNLPPAGQEYGQHFLSHPRELTSLLDTASVSADPLAREVRLSTKRARTSLTVAGPLSTAPMEMFMPPAAKACFGMATLTSYITTIVRAAVTRALCNEIR